MLASGPSARAANATWTGANGTDWNTGTNWSTLAKPGATDTALFNTALGLVTNASANQTVGSISFDTDAGTDSGSFTLGSAPYSLILGNTGTIQLLATLLGTGKSISINSPIVLTPASTTTAGAYTFTNNATDATNTLNFGGTISASLTNNTETLTLSGTNTGANTISGNITNGSATTFALAKTGAGTWILSGANTYNGGTTISAGTLKLGNAAALGASTGAASVTAGAVLDLNGTVMTNTNALTLNGSGISSGGALINSSASAASYAGTVAMATDSSIGGNGAGTMTLNGIVSGAFNLTKVGSGTLIFGNVANTFGAGKTFTIGAGTVKLGNAASLGGSTAAVSVTGGAVLDVNGQVVANTNALTLNGSGIGGTGALINTSNSTASYAGAVALGSASTIGSTGTGNTFTVGGTITGAQNLTINAGGTQGITLTNVNNTGTVTNSGAGTGTTIITTLGTNVTGLTQAGASPLVVANAVALTASLNSFTSTGSGLFTLAAQVTGVGRNLTLSANSTGNITLTLGANNGGSITNNGTGTGLVTVGPIGALVTTGVTQNSTTSTLLLNGAGLYTGGTTITAGTLKVGHATALGATASTVSVASGGALDVNGITMTGTNALIINGTGISSGGALVNNNSSVPWSLNSAAGTYAGTVTMASDSSIGGNGGTLNLTGIVAGNYNLTKVGSNTLVLSNTAGNTFGGAGKTFTISGGTVQLVVPIAASPTTFGNALTTISVSNGAALDLSAQSNKTLYSPTNPLIINGQLNSGFGALGNSNAYAFTYGGTVTLASDSSIGGSGAGILTLNQIVSGNYNLTKVGTGGLVLSNSANSFGGSGKTFTINAGTVYLGSATTSLGAANTAVSVASGAALDLNGQTYTTNNPLTINGSGIGGTGAIINSSYSAANYSSAVTLASDSTIATMSGRGGLTISGNVTGTGNLTLNATNTTLTLANVNNTGTVTNTSITGGPGTTITTLGGNVTGLTQAGALALTVTNAIAMTSGPMPFTSTGAGLLTLSGQVTGAQNLTITANSTGGITLSAGANNAGSITNNGTGNGTVTIGAIGSLVTGGVTQNAANGILSLSGVNTYTGNTTITAGTLKVASATALGAGSSAVSVATGAALDLNGTTMSNANALTLSGSGISGGGALTNNSVSGAIYTGLVTLNSSNVSIGGNGTIALTNTGSIYGTSTGYGLTLQGAGGSVAGNITGGTSGTPGAGTLTKTGTGTWTLSGTNTYTGVTTISAGTLQFANQVSLYNNTPASWTAANIKVGNTGTLALNVGGSGQFTTANVTTLLTNLGGSNGTSSTGFAAGSAIGFDTTGGNFTVGDTLADSTGTGGGALGVTKLGTNTLTLTHANTYTGPTTISAGTLTVGNATALSASTVTVASGATLDLNGTSMSNALTLNGGTLSSQSPATYSGLITLGGASTIAALSTPGGTLTISNTGTITGAYGLTLNAGAGTGNSTLASIIGTGNGTLTKSGSGLWTLTAANTFSGNTLVSGGTLALGNNLALQNSAIDTSGAGNFTLSVTTPTFGGLVGSTALATVLTTGYSSVTALTLNPGAGLTDTYSGAIANGNMTLTKTGAGTQVLTGTNSYNGTTTVSAGILQFGNQVSLYNNTPASWTAANIKVASTGTLALSVGGSGNFTTANVTTLLTNLGGSNGTSSAGYAAGSAIGFDTTGGNFAVGDIIANSTGTGGGALGLTKLGTNTLTLTGNSTYTGPTIISAGTLQIGNASDAGSIETTSGITDNGTLTYNVGAGNRTVSAAISGNGSIIQNSSGTLALAGANTAFTGNVTLNSGTLALNNAAALGTSAGALTIAGGALDNTSGAAITLSSNKTVTVNADFAFTGGNGTTHDLNLGTGAVSLGTTAGTSRTITSNAGTLTLGGIISNGTTANSIIKAGNGALTLAGANTFTGGVTLNTGTLNINNAAALGTGNFTIAGGTIGNTSGTSITSTNYPQTWNADFAFTGAGLSNVYYDLSMGAGAVTLGTTGGTSRTITVNSGTLYEGGVIANGAGGANSLIKAGNGTLSLAGANTFTGGVTLTAGTLNINAAAALGTGTFTINGGTLAQTINAGSGGNTGMVTSNYVQTWNGDFGFTIAPVTSGLFQGVNMESLNLGTGAVSLGLVAGGNATRTITVGGTDASNGYYGNLAIGGVISNGVTATGITKNGAGVLTLNGANLFTGGVTLNAGTLQIGNAAALGTTAGTFTINGGSLAVSSAALTLNNYTQQWNGSFSLRPNIPAATGYALTMGTGAITLGGNVTVTATVAANALTVNGPIGDGANTYGVTWVAGYYANNPTITLTGASTYHGPTVVQSQDGFTNSQVYGSPPGNVAMATGTLLNTSSVTVNGNGYFSVGSGTQSNGLINPNATLTIGGNGGGYYSFVSSTTTANKQSFVSLSIGSGTDVIRDSSSIPSQFTFTGANPYLRSVGGVALFLNVDTNTKFTSAPSGGGNVIGNGTTAMLVGATWASTSTPMDATNFVLAASGNFTTLTSAANSWGTGINTDVAAGSTAIGALSQSLRFNAAGSLTLPGAFTVESGGILMAGAPTAPVTITGGTIKTGISGGDLWVVESGAGMAGNQAVDPTHGLIINSQIIDNGGSSLTKAGMRALFLTNTSNNYTGGTYLADGILNVASAGSLGSGALNFTGNAQLQAAGNVDLGTRAVTIGTGLVATFDTNGNNISVGGVISGVNSALTKTGLGMLTLTGSGGSGNSYTGITAVTNGTLKLDFSAAGAPTSNIINPNSILNIGPGANAVGYSNSLIIQGAANVANSQTFGATPSPIQSVGATNVLGGMTNMVFTAGAGGSLTVNLGNIVGGSNASSLDVTTSGNVTVAGVNNTMGLGGYLDKGFNNSGGNNCVWVTVNKSTWATVDSSGNLVGMANSAYTQNTGGVIALGKIADIVTSGTLLPGAAAASTLRFNDTLNTGVGTTLTLSGTAASQLVMGGILVTANVGAHDTTITGGFLAGAYMARLGIFQNNTLGNLIINSQITDNVGAYPLHKNGAGTLILNGINTTAIGFVLNEGTIIATGDYMPSSVKTIITTAGSNVIAMTDTTGLFVGQVIIGTTPGLWVNNGGAPAYAVQNVVTAINPGVSVTVTNAASASNTLSATFQSGGALGGFSSSVAVQSIANGATLQIGSAATGNHGGVDPNDTFTNLGALILNHSGAYTFGNTITGTLAINSLSNTNATNTLEIAGGGNTTLGAYGVVNGSGIAGQYVYTLATAGNVYQGQLVTGTGIQGGTYVSSVNGLNVTLTNANLTGGATNATFQTANTFNGATRITGGSTLTLGSALALQNSTLNYNTGGTFSFGAFTAVTLGGLSGNNSLSLTNASSSAVALTLGGTYNTNTVTNNFNTTYSGNLSGNGSITKNGIGTTTLSGTNSYSGGTTVTAGTLQIGSATGLGASSGAVTVAAGATLDLNGQTVTNTNALNLSGQGFSIAALTNSSASPAVYNGPVTAPNAVYVNIGGPGNITLNGIVSTNFWLTKVGTGTLTLNGANTFGQSRSITISAGTLQLGNATALGYNASPVSVTDGAALDLSGQTITNSYPLTLNGTGISGGGALTNTSATASYAGTVAMASDSSVGGTGNSTLSGVVSGAFNLTKVGTGTLVLSNAANTFGGSGKTFTISAGTVQLGSTTTSLGTALTAVSVTNGAALDVNGQTFTTANPLTLNGTGISGGGALINSSNTAASYAGAVTLGSASTIGSTGTGNTFTVGGTVTGAQNLTINAGGTQAITLTNVNNTGAVTNNGAGAGTTTITTLGSLVTGLTEAGASPFTITNAVGLTASLNTFTSTGSGLFTLAAQVTGAQPLTLSANSTGNITLTAGANNGGSITNNGSGTNTVTVGTIGSNVTSVTQNAANSLLLLNGANTYTGKTVVQNGTVSFTTGNTSSTGAQSLGANSDLDLGVATTSSGTLNYTGAAGTLAKNINALGNGSDTIQNNGTGTLTLTGTITKNGTVLTLKGGTNGITVSGTGTIAGSNSGSDLVVDGGNVTLSTANTYNGPTSIINGATLTANATGALPTAIRSAVSIDQTGSGTSTLALGASQSAASLTGNLTSKVTLGSNTLTLGMTGNSTTTFAGVISGTNGNVIKDGTSIQVFSGNNTYTGTTAVNEGTLEAAAAGALGATSAITVTNTGTLLLSANAATSNSTTLTLNGGKVELKTGPSVSTSLGALTLTDTSIIDFGLSSTNNILTLGAVTSWTSTKTIEIWNWSGTPFFGGGSERLMVSDTTGWTTNLGSINFFTDSGTTLIGGGGAMFAGYELVAVPEPATWSYMAAIALGGAALLIRRRRLIGRLKY